MKTCTKCKTTKSFSGFHKDSNTKDGYRPHCKPCRSASDIEYYDKKLEEGGKTRRIPLSEKEKIENQKARRRKHYRKNKSKEKDAAAKWAKRNPKKDLLNKAKGRAKKKGVAFEISEDDFDMPEECPLLEIPLYKGDGSVCDNSPTLDRKVPKKGYTPENVWIISNKANRIKTNATCEEILAVAENLMKKLK